MKKWDMLNESWDLMDKMEIVRWIVMFEQTWDLLMICDEHDDNQLWFDVFLSVCVCVCVRDFDGTWLYSPMMWCVWIDNMKMNDCDWDWLMNKCFDVVCDRVELRGMKQIHSILVLNSSVCDWRWLMMMIVCLTFKTYWNE